MSLDYRFNQWYWGFVDWLFPPICGGCGKAGSRWCQDCQQQLKFLTEPVCQACGLPLSHSGFCVECAASRPPYDMLRSWVVFEGPIRRAIHTLKYRRNTSLGEIFGRYLAGYVRELNWNVDLVVPVPLGRLRKKARGYNQAELLALPLSIFQKWRYSKDAVSRIRETKTQVGLNAKERMENLANAFCANPVFVEGKSILLVDDVATTGATLANCSEAILHAGATNVYTLTLARALPYHGLKIV